MENKLGIHHSDYLTMLAELKERLDQNTYDLVASIIEKYETRYL